MRLCNPNAVEMKIRQILGVCWLASLVKPGVPGTVRDGVSKSNVESDFPRIVKRPTSEVLGDRRPMWIGILWSSKHEPVGLGRTHGVSVSPSKAWADSWEVYFYCASVVLDPLPPKAHVLPIVPPHNKWVHVPLPFPGCASSFMWSTGRPVTDHNRAVMSPTCLHPSPDFCRPLRITLQARDTEQGIST